MIAAVIAISNPVAFALGLKVRGHPPAVGGIIVLSVLMGGCAVGLVKRRYWAILGFEALLAFTLLAAGLSLTVAANIAAVAVCLLVLGLGGFLFYKLIRVMSRIQMPTRTPRAP